MADGANTKDGANGWHNGQRIDAWDTKCGGAWLEAKVVRVDGESLLVHFHGFSKRQDEWMRVDSSRLARARTECERARRVAPQLSTEDLKLSKPRPKPRPTNARGLRKSCAKSSKARARVLDTVSTRLSTSQ